VLSFYQTTERNHKGETEMAPTLSDFFGDGSHCVNCGENWYDDGVCSACKESEEIAAARQLAYLERIGDQEGAANVRKAIEDRKRENAQAEEAWQRAVNHQATNADLNLLVKIGWAEPVYDDPESNRPTSAVLIRHDAPGNPYSDQAGLEENAGKFKL
jgi:hypothetical protein